MCSNKLTAIMCAVKLCTVGAGALTCTCCFVDEIALEPGDVVGIAGNHWDGYSKGSNKRTGGIGLYPSYKTEDKKVIVKYPDYPEVPLTGT